MALPAHHHPRALPGGARAPRGHPGQLAPERLLRGQRHRRPAGERGALPGGVQAAGAELAVLDADGGPPPGRGPGLPRPVPAPGPDRHRGRPGQVPLRAGEPADQGRPHRDRGARRGGGAGHRAGAAGRRGALQGQRRRRLLPDRPAPLHRRRQLHRHQLPALPHPPGGPAAGAGGEPPPGGEEPGGDPHHQRLLPPAPRGVEHRRGGRVSWRRTAWRRGWRPARCGRTSPACGTSRPSACARGSSWSGPAPTPSRVPPRGLRTQSPKNSSRPHPVRDSKQRRQADREAQVRMPVIDTHVHVWPLDDAPGHRPVQGAKVRPPQAAAPVEWLLEDMAEHGIAALRPGAEQRLRLGQHLHGGVPGALSRALQGHRAGRSAEPGERPRPGAVDGPGPLRLPPAPPLLPGRAVLARRPRERRPVVGGGGDRGHPAGAHVAEARPGPGADDRAPPAGAGDRRPPGQAGHRRRPRRTPASSRCCAWRTTP